MSIMPSHLSIKHSTITFHIIQSSCQVTSLKVTSDLMLEVTSNLTLDVSNDLTLDVTYVPHSNSKCDCAHK